MAAQQHEDLESRVSGISRRSFILSLPIVSALPSITGFAQNFDREYLIGAGDIAVSGLTGAGETARLLQLIPGTIFTAGDNVYSNWDGDGSREAFELTWGSEKGRIKFPTPGNHDYETKRGQGYFDYFGATAHPESEGFYSDEFQGWHVVAINTNIPMHRGSLQYKMLQQDLEKNREERLKRGIPCSNTLVIAHHPRFSSGPNWARVGSKINDLFKLIYEYGADIIVSGDDHFYERFHPQNPSGDVDNLNGITQYVAGTGGAWNYFADRLLPNSSFYHSQFGVWGVLRFMLMENGWQSDFVTTNYEVLDSHRGQSHLLV